MVKPAFWYLLAILAITTAQSESAFPPDVAGQLTQLEVALQQKSPGVQVQAWTKVARILALRYPAIALKYALRADVASGPHDTYTKAQIYEVMLGLDPSAAERIGRKITNKDALFSAAMRHCHELRDVQCGVQTLRKALLQGGYSISDITWIFDSLNNLHSTLTDNLLEDMIIHFPQQNCSIRDCQTLLDAVRSAARPGPARAREAADKIQSALNLPTFEDHQDEVITGKIKIGDAVLPASTTKEFFQIQIDALKTGRTAVPVVTNYAFRRSPTKLVRLEQPDDTIEQLLADLRNQAQGMSDFTLNDLSGRAYKLSAAHGKALLVNFWATWCGPCRSEMPKLEALYKEGVPILAVTDEESAVIRRFLSKTSFVFPVLLDTNGSVFRRYQIEALPTTLLVNSQGRIVARWNELPSSDGLRALLRDAQR